MSTNAGSANQAEDQGKQMKIKADLDPVSLGFDQNEHLRHALLFLFHQKKEVIESHRLLVETYGEHAPSVGTCETWFQKFKSGDFDLTDSKRSSRPKKGEF